MSRTSTLVEINKKKGYAKLADNTVWRIPEGHLGRVKEWEPGLELTIEKSDNAMWQAKLVNNGVWVSASPHSGRTTIFA